MTHTTISVRTSRRNQMIDITAQLAEAIADSGVQQGTAMVFCPHTTAAITINENADPDVRVDMESHFNHMVPEDAPYYRHTVEGPDDMTSHIKSSLLGSSVSVPITDGKFNLGTWQGIFLCEHRNSPHHRKVVITLCGTDKSK